MRIGLLRHREGQTKGWAALIAVLSQSFMQSHLSQWLISFPTLIITLRPQHHIQSFTEKVTLTGGLCAVQSPPGELRSPHARGMGMDLQGLRSRLAGIKDTFANTTRSLKGRWGGHRGACDHNGHHQDHHQHPRGGSPPSTPSASSSAHVNGPQRATSS